MQREMAHLETADDGSSCSSAAAAAAAVIAATVSISSCLGLVWASVAAAAVAAAAASIAPHCQEARKCHRAARGPQAEVASLARHIHTYLWKHSHSAGCGNVLVSPGSAP